MISHRNSTQRRLYYPRTLLLSKSANQLILGNKLYFFCTLLKMTSFFVLYMNTNSIFVCTLDRRLGYNSRLSLMLHIHIMGLMIRRTADGLRICMKMTRLINKFEVYFTRWRSSHFNSLSRKLLGHRCIVLLAPNILRYPLLKISLYIFHLLQRTRDFLLSRLKSNQMHHIRTSRLV